jgi:hypothetical protein
MKPVVKTISLQEYTEAIRRYYKDDELQKHQRLGQFFINVFNIELSEADEDNIFYETDEKKVMQLISTFIEIPA